MNERTEALVFVIYGWKNGLQGEPPVDVMIVGAKSSEGSGLYSRTRF